MILHYQWQWAGTVLYAAQDGVSSFVWPYFVLAIGFGSFICLNL
eukprot:SAG22_NODE_18568_length_285_cov_0.779570_2_plen_43_part_01